MKKTLCIFFVFLCSTAQAATCKCRLKPRHCGWWYYQCCNTNCHNSCNNNGNQQCNPGNNNNNTGVDENGCPFGWTFRTRPSGGFCFNVFAGTMTQPEAVASCQKHSAFLAGVQDQQELTLFTERATQVIRQSGYSSGGIWIGGTRKSECRTTSNIPAQCFPATKQAFVWNDNMVTGVDGFIFRDGQPDNNMGNQNCLYLLGGSPSNDVWGTWYPGTMDDTKCDYTLNDRNMDRSIRGYVCGIRSRTK
ncbi:unnamed protein product [Caenorhabditis bovis]|uniref:C-type lectin domain-containing protein n=1 Tax=Caenorhabditis bovis TaxID=2654633 RepID=A0A8S1ERW4_9PELO|nr:unnamed protein product [Caenorhabditis bovis]